ncbi:LacI family DNA-binding transcriptional regulator [Parafilimonas sp.]|uniref:LacI family DNA-binding transcriptional regulator n=1 Tax=Parafilimonas sp. TaxID=1969739 RepID=UPI003F7F2450
MIRCVKCNMVHAISKSGKLRGKQRYYCKECNIYFTIHDTDKKDLLDNNHKRHIATIADIAKALNVSKSTVSRALHEHSDINEQTRRAVLQMAKELDYQPNLLAKSLVQNKTNTIGIIVPEFLTYFFPTVIIGAQQIASAAGYNVIICQSQESYETEVSNANVLIANRVDGVLISMTRETKNFDHYKRFERHGIPVVFFNRVCDEMNVPKVLVNDYNGAFKATEHLIKSGYRRIAHIGGPANLRLSHNRLNGYKDALKKHKLPILDELITSCDLSKQAAIKSAKQLLELTTPPDAVFCVNDPAAIQLMLVAKNKGIDIPEDLGVVGFSNDPIAAIIEPALTTVEQPVAEMGRKAMQLLIDKLNGHIGKSTPAYLSLNTKLVVRKSSVMNDIS